MADILLIHGSGHGAWCWRAVLPRLAARGHTARAIDLPGLGDDPTPPAEAGPGACLAAIGAALGPRTVLVGHSLGGMSVSAAAEAFPDRVARRVYLAAWVPQNGQSAADLRRQWASEALTAATRISDDGLTTSFDPAALPGLFFHDCPAADAAFAAARLRPQPLAVARAPARLGPAAASVPASYIRCTADRAILPRGQAALSEGWDDVHEIACGHSPFFAAPDSLAEILHAIAETT